MLAGAGVFVTTVVAGGVAMVKPFTAASRPFLRDVIFYMVAVFLTFMVLYFGRITLGEALGEHCGRDGFGGGRSSLGCRNPACAPPPSQGTWGSMSSTCSPWCSAPGSTDGSGGKDRPPPAPGNQVRAAWPMGPPACWGVPPLPPFSPVPPRDANRC